MNELSKKLGYVRGLLESNGDKAPDAAFAKGVYELLEGLVERIETLDEMFEDLNDYVESIDDDLASMESDRDLEAFANDSDGDISAQLRVLEGLKDSLPDPDEPDDEDEEEEDDEDDFDSIDEIEDIVPSLCPRCHRMFFVPMQNEPDLLYLCPFCKKAVSPDPVTPENTPIVYPID